MKQIKILNIGHGFMGGKAHSHAILEAKIGRTVYHLWKKQIAFDAKKFLASPVTMRCHSISDNALSLETLRGQRPRPPGEGKTWVGDPRDTGPAWGAVSRTGANKGDRI